MAHSKFEEILSKYRNSATEFFTDFQHTLDYVTVAFDQVLISSQTGGDIEKIQDSLGLVFLAFFNRSCLEHAIRNGLFMKLMNLFYNVKQAAEGPVKSRAILTISGGFTYYQ